MFAATRDLRREREKFKNMMTQPISSLITERNLPKDSFMQNMPMQPYPNSRAEENFEQAEEETRRVFGAAENAFGGLEEVKAAFGISEETGADIELEKESAFYTAEETAKTEQNLTAFKEESSSLFAAASEKAGRISENIWEETGTVFGAGRKERPLQTADIYSDYFKIQEKKENKTDFKVQEEFQVQENFEAQQKLNVQEEIFETEKDEFETEIQQSQLTKPISEDLQESFTEEWRKEETKEEVSEDLKEEESEYEEELEEDTGFLGESFFEGEFYYQVPEKEEPEYIEVSFSLDQLDTNEIPAEIYYRIPDYDPQAFLNKMANQIEKEEDKEEENKRKEDKIEEDKKE